MYHWCQKLRTWGGWERGCCIVRAQEGVRLCARPAVQPCVPACIRECELQIITGRRYAAEACVAPQLVLSPVVNEDDCGAGPSRVGRVLRSDACRMKRSCGTAASAPKATQVLAYVLGRPWWSYPVHVQPGLFAGTVDASGVSAAMALYWSGQYQPRVE